MLTDQQQERATRYALGELDPAEEQAFIAQVRVDPQLRDFLHSLQRTLDRLALAAPRVAPSPGLKERVLGRLSAQHAQSSAPIRTPSASPLHGLRFLAGSDTGWKPLPVRGAYIKLLSLQADRGYALLLGKLDAGVRYPAHTNVGPEDFYILSGDLHVGQQVLRAGDFHHADAGSQHGENYSVEGCTLFAVLTTDDPLVQLALS